MHMLEFIVELLEWTVNITASAVMIWGFAVAVVSFVKVSFGAAATERIMRLQVVRCDLGVKLVFALELLIISDLLHTIISRSMEDMIMVGVLVLIRTVIAFFLNKEIQEVGAEISKTDGKS